MQIIGREEEVGRGASSAVALQRQKRLELLEHTLKKEQEDSRQLMFGKYRASLVVDFGIYK